MDGVRNNSGNFYSWAVPDLEGIQRILLRTPFSGNIDFFESDSLSVVAGSPCSDLRFRYERAESLYDDISTSINIYLDGDCGSEKAVSSSAIEIALDGVQLTQILTTCWLLASACGFLIGLLYGFWHYKKYRSVEAVTVKNASDQSRTDETALSSTLKSGSNSANNASLLNYNEMCTNSPSNHAQVSGGGSSGTASSGKPFAENVVANTLPHTRAAQTAYGYGYAQVQQNSEDVLPATLTRVGTDQLVIVKEKHAPVESPSSRLVFGTLPRQQQVAERPPPVTSGNSLKAPLHMLSPSPSDACLATFRIFNNDRERSDAERVLVTSPTDDDLAVLHATRGANGHVVQQSRVAHDSLDSGCFSNSRSADSAQLRCADLEGVAGRRAECESNSNSSSRASSEKQRRTVTVLEPPLTIPIPSRVDTSRSVASNRNGRSVAVTTVKEHASHRQPIREEDEEHDEDAADDFERDDLMGTMRPLALEDDDLVDDDDYLVDAHGAPRHVFDIRDRVQNGEFFVSLTHDDNAEGDDTTWQRRVDRYDELFDAQHSPDDQSAFFFSDVALRSPQTNAKLMNVGAQHWQRAPQPDAYYRTLPGGAMANRREHLEEPIDTSSLSRRRPGSMSSHESAPLNDVNNDNVNNRNPHRRRLQMPLPGLFNALLLLSAIFAVALGNSNARTRASVFNNAKVRAVERRLSESSDGESLADWHVATVNLTVFLPASLMRRVDLLIGSRSIVNVTADFTLAHDPRSTDTVFGGESAVQLKVYEVPFASWSGSGLPNASEAFDTKCDACNHLCDPVSRSCVCMSGYRQGANNAQCVDVDECELQRSTNVAEYAANKATSARLCGTGYECVNMPLGSYRCVCAAERGRVDAIYDSFSWPLRSTNHSTAQPVCLSCTEQCPNGYYASTQCASTGGRFQYCTKCTSCPAGFYVSQLCTQTHDTRCAKCAMCAPSEFEVAPCSLIQNRICRSMKHLPGIVSSSANVLSENRQAVREDVTERFYSMPNGASGRTIKFDRGTNYSVRVQLHELNPIAQFRAVDHRHRNDDSYFRGNPDIREQFCEHPLPESYTLLVDVYENVTAKAKFDPSAAHLGFEMDLDGPCRTAEEQQIGSFPEMRGVACHRLSTRAARVFSGVASRLQLDGINIDVAQQTDKSRICARMKAFCQQCMSQCGQSMAAFGADHECGVAAGDEDNGYSLRLPTCLACCATQNCSSVCNSYYSDAQVCNTLRCVTGTVLDFRLLPSFHKRGDEFYCHVEPDRVRPVYAFSYQLFARDIPLTPNTTVHGYFESFIDSSATRRHQFLTVHYTPSLATVPDIVYGQLSADATTLRVGRWNTHGQPLGNAALSGARANALRVRPLKPFAVSSSTWRAPTGADCLRRLDTLLDNVVLSGSPTDSVEPLQSDFYTLQQVDFDNTRGAYSQLAVALLAKSTFSVRNLSASEKPFVALSIDRSESVLVHAFPRSNVYRDSLKVAVQPSTTQNQLLLNVSGTLQICRGSFIVRVYSLSAAAAASAASVVSGSESDVENERSLGLPMYDYEVATYCPNAFELIFAVPSIPPPDASSFRSLDLSRADTAGRSFLVRVLQADGEIRTVVSYAYPQQSVDTNANVQTSAAGLGSDAAGRSGSVAGEVRNQDAAEAMQRADQASIMGYYSARAYGYVMDLPFELSLWVLLGLVGLLVVLASLYVLFYLQSSNNALRRSVDDHQLHVRHVFLFAIGCCAKLAYASLVSFSVFTIVFVALNGPSLTRLSTVPNYMVNLTAENDLVIELINSRMNAELNRFNARLDARFNVCDAAVERLYGHLFTEMRDDAMRNVERFDELRSLVAAARSRAIRKLRAFNEELLTFTAEFNLFADEASAAIVELASSAYRKLADANTAWLAPANAVYRAFVQRRAEALRAGTVLQGGLAKPFDEWTNVATDIQGSAVDLRIDLEVPLVDLGPFERLFDAVSLNESFLAATNNTGGRKPPPLLNLPRTVIVESTQKLDDDVLTPENGPTTPQGASQPRNEPAGGFATTQSVNFLVLLVTVAAVCDVLLISSRFISWKTAANYALNGYPILLNVDAQADADADSNSTSTNHIGANALRHSSNGGTENELRKAKVKKDTMQSVHSRPKRVALSVFTTLLERDWLLGVATLVVAFFTLDLVNVATDRLADGRVLNARFGIYSRLLDPVSVYDELSTASLNEYKSFVLDRYLAVYENSLNNDLRLLEAFRTAWSSAKLTRSDAIRKLVRALDASRAPDSTADSDGSLRDTLATDWSSQVRSNVSHSCRFDDLIIDEATARTVRLVTQSEFDYNLRLAHLVDNGEAYLNELRLIVRRTTFLLFVYVATMICYTFVSRFCEMFSVRFHLVRLRFVYTSGVAHANADAHR